MWREVGEAAADVLLGRTCAGCGRAGPLVCGTCLSWLSGYGPRIVRPRPTPPGLPMTVASAPYVGPVRGLVHRYKESSALGLAGVMADRLVLSLLGLLHRCLEDGLWHPAPVVLVPAPSRRQAVLRRGSDVTARFSALAAARLAAATDLPVSSRRLVGMTRRTLDQAGLDAGGRQANLTGNLVARGRLPHGDTAVIVVDDVVTTGATLAELGRVLRGRGVRVLGAATVAATPRRSDGAVSASPAGDGLP